MSDDNNESGRSIGLETIIPQETTGGVFDTMLGLSIGEVALVALPTALLAYVELTYISVPVMWLFVSVGGLAGGLYFAVKQTPWYATPLETIFEIFTVVAIWIRIDDYVQLFLLGQASRVLRVFGDIIPLRGRLQRQ